MARPRILAREGASQLGEVTPREEVIEGVEESTESMARTLAVCWSSWLGEALRKRSVGNKKRIREKTVNVALKMN